VETVEVLKSEIKGVHTEFVHQPVSDLVYFRGVAEIQSVPQDLVPYIPLFCKLLTEMGTEKQNDRQLAQNIERYTGGISVGHSEVTDPNDLTKLQVRLYLSGMALERNVGKMFELLSEVLTCPIFDNKDLLTTHISSSASSLQESLMGSGHRYALTNAVAPFRTATFLSELWGGIGQVSFMSELLMRAQEGDLQETVTKLQELAKFLLKSPLSKVSVTTEEQYAKDVKKRLTKFLDSPFGQSRPKVQNLGEHNFETGSVAKNYIAMPGSVNYVAKAFPTVHYTHPDAPKLQLLSELVTHQYLHREVREKGGAYGAGLSFHTGYIGFYSYRDPHIERTLETFDKTLDWLRNTPIKDEWIEQAKFHVFSGLDAPVSPSKKGTTEFNTGVTYAMRQEKRVKLLAATKNDLIEAAERHLRKEDGASISVLGSENNTKFKSDKTWNYIEP